MRIINISNHQFRKMQQYIPDTGTGNMECELYLLKEKYKWIAKSKLYKKFNSTSGQYFSNKLYVISKLIDCDQLKQCPQFVLPTELISLDGEINGYSMPFIEHNISASNIMISSSSHDKKIECLKQIGKLLENIENMKMFYPTDVHEGNFIYDLDDQMMKMVDMDSVTIDKSESHNSKYLTFNPNLWNYPHKYPLNDNDRHIANKNTMYLSYIYMILNYISSCCYINQIGIDEYYAYMGRLRRLGLDQNLVDVFELIYTEGENISPLPYLDTIPENLKKFNYRR